MEHTPPPPTPTPTRGVIYDPATRKYRAFLTVRGRFMDLGQHESEAEASAAHDRKAREIFGTKAQLNGTKPK